MLQPDFVAALTEPVPPVKPSDIRRVWSFLAVEKALFTSVERAEGGFGISCRVLAEQCDVHSNVVAVFFRATLVQLFLQQGLLDGWRDGDGLGDRVFEVAATFRLPRGLTDVDTAGFSAAL